MSRFALATSFVLLFAGCSKKPEAKGELKSMPADPSPAGEMAGARTGGAPAVGGADGAAGGGAADERFRLKPEEGQLAVQAPADAKAGSEATATIQVTPGPEYKVNVEFPTKLTLENAEGVTLAKAEFKAGGPSKDKGDADSFDDHKLTFTVKLTPTAAGAQTVKGSLKFAVCDKAGSTCLAKKEPIAIQVAAK